MNTELLEPFNKLPPQHQEPPGKQETMVNEEDDAESAAAGMMS